MSLFLTAIASFVSTNIDDIFVLMILYAQVTNHRELHQVVLGQYVGIGILLAISIVGALGTQLFSPKYIGLLGILPIILGIKAWFDYHKKETPTSSQTVQIQFLDITGLTIANGADNIGVYIPVFSQYHWIDFCITLIVFSIMIGIWC